MKKIKRIFKNLKKTYYFLYCRRLHTRLLAKLEGKDTLNVVFLVNNYSTWKLNNVFEKMLQSNFYNPIALITPINLFDKHEQDKEIDLIFQNFTQRKFPVIRATLDEKNSYSTLEALSPDIIFFSNPHKIVNGPIYYEHIFKNYLTCYVPYFYALTTTGSEEAAYDQIFHNSMWKIFSPNEYHLEESIKRAANKGKNCFLTGYPLIEEIEHSAGIQAWKKQVSPKKKIIWAPHHSITSYGQSLSTFLRYSNLFVDLSEKYKDSLQWAFKPHPILKNNLYQHPDWGKIKTDNYFKYWNNQTHTQLEEGSYSDLFNQSDAMIHDSGSFLGEYLFTLKPVMYLPLSDNLSKFAKDAINACKLGTNSIEIESFLIAIINGTIKLNSYHLDFVSHQKNQVPAIPSKKIIETITESLI